MQITSIIDELLDKRQRQRDWESIRGIFLHRCGVDLRYDHVLGHDGLSVGRAFTGRVDKWKDVAKATGNENAYTFFVGGDLGPSEFDGRTWQAIPLSEVGYHARQFSAPWLGLGFIGDFRYKAPSDKQFNAGIDLCVELCQGLGLDPMEQIKGHGEVPETHDGSKAPGKPNACPGDLFNVDKFRHEVQAILLDRGRKALHDAGMVY